MNGPNPDSIAKIAGHPIHPMIVQFPIVFFISAFITDLVFLWTQDAGWAQASLWLLGAGIVTALVAAVIGLIDFSGEPRIRRMNDAWMHAIGNVILVLVQAVNFYLRYTGDMTSVIATTGAYLSGISVLILLFTGWKGGTLVFRRAVGVDKLREGILPETDLRARPTARGPDETRPM